jgi:calcineurin-like phosphoesterase family protein
VRFYSSDHHFGHLRIPELARRPFAATPDGIAEMNQEILRRHNERVGTDDRMWALGDFAMGQIADTLPLVKNMNGEIILIAGNHDRCFPGYGKKWMDWTSKYHDAGFYIVYTGMPGEAAAVQQSVAGHPVFMCHFPYKDGGDSRSGEPERWAEWRPENHGFWLLCGHVHQQWRQRGRMINIGIDAWGGYPVSEEEVGALIGAGPNDLEALPW